MTSSVAERLSPANSGWLKEFSVVMHRRSAYPPRHPSRLAAEESALRAISRALESEPRIAIAITHRQLTIGGASSDPKNPALGELAERLHRRGIAAITLRAGITALEFERLLDRLASRPDTTDDDDDDTPSLGAHVTVEMLSYERLVLADELDDEGQGPDAKGDRLWRELAEAALAGSPSGSTAADASAESIASSLNARAGNAGYAAGVVQSMLRAGRHARRRGREGSGAVAARLRDTIAKLEPGALSALLMAEADPGRRQLLLLQGVDALPLSAVLDWIEAAAASRGESISRHLLRLLRGLATQAARRRDGGDDEDGESLRQAARRLIEDWNFEITGAEPHSALLDRIAALETTGSTAAGSSAGDDRIVQIALETNVVGPDVLAAVDHLIDGRRLDFVVKLLGEADRATIAAPEIAQHLLEPETVRRALLAEPVEPTGARELLARCAAPQAEAILDALAISESKDTRALILDRLRELGDAVRDPMIARLDGAPWYVQRNLIMLLAELPEPPSNLPFDTLTKHEEPMLRLEAMKLAARFPDRRDAAIHDGLGDFDARVVRATLEVARTGLPRRSGPRIVQILDQFAREPEIRLRAIPLLAQVPLPAARDWLLACVLPRRGAFVVRRSVLAPKTPEMLAALRVLAARWSADPAAARVFKLAAKSDDRQVVEAATARGRA